MSSERHVSSNVLKVLAGYSTQMQNGELHSLITRLRHAALQDVHDTNAKLLDMHEVIHDQLTKRDLRDARLQHTMDAHGVPLDEHMARVCRSFDNLNTLYYETFGNPDAYVKGKELVESTDLYRNFNTGDVLPNEDNSNEPPEEVADRRNSDSDSTSGDDE